jgi:outer membrane biosynthesis protein TonB
VTLSEENSWRYTWSDLDSNSEYHVAEQNVPSGYTVSVVQEGTAFVVTNTYTPPANPTPTPTTTPTPTPSASPSPEPTPSPPESPEPSVSPVVSPEPSVSPSVSPVPETVTTKPTTPSTSPTTTPTTTTTTTKLPQTGQLWWPVTILALLGLVLLMLGWGIHRRGNDHES